MPKLLLLACQPKSGSTFLSKYLARMAGGRPCSFVPAFGRREQELSEVRLLKIRMRPSRLLVGQHHVRCSDETIRLVRRYGISVVVLRRNLFDAVASIRDHFRRESHIAPMMYLEEQMLGLPDRELEVAIARFAIPWYLNFHMSWRHFDEAVFVDYEDLRSNANACAAGILDHFGIRIRAPNLDAAQVTRGTRFNKGVSGRGAGIAEEAIQLVREQVRFYAQFCDDSYLDARLSD